VDGKQRSNHVVYNVV